MSRSPPPGDDTHLLLGVAGEGREADGLVAHSGQPSAPNGRWCPYCGADLSHIPVREEPPEDAVFAAAGRRLKVALAVGVVGIWLVVSLADWVLEPDALSIPGWFSALGAFLLLVVLLGIQPWGWIGGRRR